MKIKVFIYVFIIIFYGCSSQNIETNNIQKEINQEKTELIGIKDENVYPVIRVIDGDTFVVKINNKNEKIRIIGIDTPEKEGGYQTVECFGDHASDYAKKYLKNKKVSLLKSKKQNNRDKYGRMLRYVFINGEDFGAKLIKEGYAFSFKRYKHERISLYNKLEKEAKSNKKGMWNPKNCEYWK